MRVVLRVSAISVIVLGPALAIGASRAVAADCLSEPNRDAPAGQHWYYHLDRGGERKCWYLHATVTGPAEAPELQPARQQRRPNPADAEPPRRQAMPARPVLPLRRQAAPSPAPEPPREQAPAAQRQVPRSEADEAALYLEFLRWKEQHRGEQ